MFARRSISCHSLRRFLLSTNMERPPQASKKEVSDIKLSPEQQRDFAYKFMNLADDVAGKLSDLSLLSAAGKLKSEDIDKAQRTILLMLYGQTRDALHIDPAIWAKVVDER